ncbi:MAG: hypothetical protein BGO10_06845 [Chlamydia sp. 32-24]|nr:MAG: hypothetical protein BGO10_06845 [Chlamydia sp. 32-24]
MKSRQYFIHLLYVLIFFPLCLLHAQTTKTLYDNGLQLNYCEEQFKEITINEIVLISCVIKNTTSQTKVSSFFINAPQGWQILNESENFELAGNELSPLIYAIKAPEDTKSGIYSLYITSKISKEEIPITIFIKPHYKTTFAIRSCPKFVQAGEEYNIECTCLNEGNEDINYCLSISSDLGLPIYQTNNYNILAPLQRENVIISIKTPPSVENELHNVIIKVFNPLNEEIFFCGACTTEILPSNGLSYDRFTRIPSYVKFLSTGQNSKIVGAIELEGKGLIDEERDREIEYFFRLPTDSQNVIYDEYQKYYLGIFDPDWDLVAGDTVYSLSALTQRWRYGRGFGLDIYRNKWESGVFFAQKILKKNKDPNEWGGYFTYLPKESVNISANFLNKAKINHCHKANICSISSLINFSNEGKGIIEFAKNTRIAKSSSNAFHLAYRGKITNKFWIDFEKIYAGSTFNGYYHNVNLLATTADISLSGPLRCQISQYHLKQRTPLVYNSCQENVRLRQYQYNAQMQYTYPNGNYIGANALFLRGLDKSYKTLFNFYQQWAGITLGTVRPNYSIQLASSVGSQKDFYRCNEQNKLVQRHLVYLSKDFNSVFQGSLQYEIGQTDYYDIHSWRTLTGIAGNFKLAQRTWLQLYYQRTSHLYQHIDQDQFSIRFGHTFENSNAFYATFLKSMNNCFYPRDNNLFLVEYTIPFGLPLAERRDIGSVYGTLLNEHTHEPITNALVSLDGKKAFTDKSGFYQFQGVKKGHHHLKTEVLPSNLITCNPEGKEIFVHGGSNQYCPLMANTSGTIKGKVVLFAYNKEYILENDQIKMVKELNAKGEYPGLRVTIHRDSDEIYTLLTDELGEFYFSGLRPGNWTVIFHTEQLPDHYQLYSSEYKFHLEEDEVKEFFIKIIAKEE